MNATTSALIEVHKAEIARLRAAGDHRAADALAAALRRYVEDMERENGRAPQ
jgi:hypothetical protein